MSFFMSILWGQDSRLSTSIPSTSLTQPNSLDVSKSEASKCLPTPHVANSANSLGYQELSNSAPQSKLACSAKRENSYSLSLHPDGLPKSHAMVAPQYFVITLNQNPQ